MNIQSRLNRAAVLAREQERARLDRELFRLPDLMAPMSEQIDWEAWFGGGVDLPSALLCDVMASVRAELPAAIGVGAELSRRVGAGELALPSVSDLELWAMIAEALSRAAQSAPVGE